MESQRFVDNLRQLLKSFHKNLSGEAEAVCKKATARSLRSRQGRLRISQQIAAHIQKEPEEVSKGDRIDLQVGLEDKHHVKTWLSRVSERPGEPQRHTWVPEEGIGDEDIDAESSTTSSDEGSKTGESPHISDLEGYLRQTRPFQTLLKEFMLMFLPTELRHVLLSIPKAQIWVSQEQDLSVAKRAKAFIEDNTHVRWNWWPLEPRRRILQNGEARMFWHCTCGSKQWEEIAAEHLDLVTKILDISDDKPQTTHWCRMKGTRFGFLTLLELMVRKLPSGPATSASTAAQRYTPTANTASASPSGHRPSPSNGSQSSGITPNQPAQQGSSTRGQYIQIRTPDPNGQIGGWILFGVQGAQRTMTPAQIRVDDQSTDHSFFQELKKRYRIN